MFAFFFSRSSVYRPISNRWVFLIEFFNHWQERFGFSFFFLRYYALSRQHVTTTDDFDGTAVLSRFLVAHSQTDDFFPI